MTKSIPKIMEGETYYFINNYGKMITTEYTGEELDMVRINQGNFFRDTRVCNRARKRIKIQNFLMTLGGYFEHSYLGMRFDDIYDEYFINEYGRIEKYDQTWIKDALVYVEPIKFSSLGKAQHALEELEKRYPDWKSNLYYSKTYDEIYQVENEMLNMSAKARDALMAYVTRDIGENPKDLLARRIQEVQERSRAQNAVLYKRSDK